MNRPIQVGDRVKLRARVGVVLATSRLFAEVLFDDSDEEERCLLLSLSLAEEPRARTLKLVDKGGHYETVEVEEEWER